MATVSIKDLRNTGIKHITENGGQIPQEIAREMQRLRALWDGGKFFSNAIIPDHHRGKSSDNESVGDISALQQAELNFVKEASNSRVPSLRLNLTRRVVDDTTTEPETKPGPEPEPEPEPYEEDEVVSTPEFDMIIHLQPATERNYSSYHNLAAFPVYQDESCRSE